MSLSICPWTEPYQLPYISSWNSTNRILESAREATKKKEKKSQQVWTMGGQQILVCEPQKSAFLELIFQKKHAEINS